MDSTEAIFLKQTDLLKQAVVLLEKRADEIEETERNKKYESASESEKKAVIGLFKVKSLRFYKDILLFIAAEAMRNEDPKHHFFLLPHTRTLFDIYSRFIHLLNNCKNDNEQALVCIGYQLLSYSTFGGESAYKTTLGLYKNFLTTDVGVVFPENAKDFDFRWLKSNKLLFAKMTTLLVGEHMENYSPATAEVFKPDRPYRIYSNFSEYLHGNPYYYSETPTNERFWIVSMALLTTSFLVELVDRHTLNRIKPRDFRLWLLDVRRNKADFIGLWASKNKPA